MAEKTKGIEDLLSFFMISNNDLLNVKGMSEIFQRHSKEITDRHYEIIGHFPALQEIIDRNSTLERLKKTFVQYLNSIPEGRLDEEYIGYLKKIGQVHHRINLSADWFIGSYLRIFERILPSLIRENRFHVAKQTELVFSLIKILTLHASIVLQAYHEEFEFEQVDHLSDTTETLTKINHFKEIIAHTSSIRSDMESITASVEELSASIDQIVVTNNRTAEKSWEISTFVKENQEKISNLLFQFQKLEQEFKVNESAIQDLFQVLEQVHQITSFIQNIAGQTHLLALNASIEAARAGEMGKGFSVVAQEVKKLADQTKESASAVKNTLQELKDKSVQVQSTIQKIAELITLLAQEAGERLSSLKIIEEKTLELDQAIQQIVTATEEQASATEEVNKGAEKILSHIRHAEEMSVKSGEEVYKISEKVNRRRIYTLSRMNHFNQKHQLRSIITDHLWLRWAVENDHITPLHESTEEKDCPFTQTIKGILLEKSLSGQTHDRLLSSHSQFHQALTAMLRANREGKGEEATKQEQMMDQSLQQFLALLQRTLPSERK